MGNDPFKQADACAGDICKSVGEGLVSVAAFAGAVFTDGATLTIGLTALGSVMEASTIRARRSSATN